MNPGSVVCTTGWVDASADPPAKCSSRKLDAAFHCVVCPRGVIVVDVGVLTDRTRPLEDAVGHRPVAKLAASRQKRIRRIGAEAVAEHNIVRAVANNVVVVRRT